MGHDERNASRAISEEAGSRERYRKVPYSCAEVTASFILRSQHSVLANARKTTAQRSLSARPCGPIPRTLLLLLLLVGMPPPSNLSGSCSDGFNPAPYNLLCFLPMMHLHQTPCLLQDQHCRVEPFTSD